MLWVPPTAAPHSAPPAQLPIQPLPSPSLSPSPSPSPGTKQRPGAAHSLKPLPPSSASSRRLPQLAPSPPSQLHRGQFWGWGLCHPYWEHWVGPGCLEMGRSTELRGRYPNGAALRTASRPISQMGKLRHGRGLPVAGLPGAWRCCGHAAAGITGRGGRAAGSAAAVPPVALYGKLTGTGSRSSYHASVGNRRARPHVTC